MDPPDVLYRPVEPLGDDEATVQDVEDGIQEQADAPATLASTLTSTDASTAYNNTDTLATQSGLPATFFLSIGLVICILLITAFFAIWATTKSRKRATILPGTHRVRYGVVTSSVETEPSGTIKTVRSSGTGSRKGLRAVRVESPAPVALVVN